MIGYVWDISCLVIKRRHKIVAHYLQHSTTMDQALMIKFQVLIIKFNASPLAGSKSFQTQLYFQATSNKDC